MLLLLLLLLPLATDALLLSIIFPAAQVTFTKDRELVCRHAQCDLHTTTNILVGERPEKKNASHPNLGHIFVAACSFLFVGACLPV